jgi:hypothetical protein
MAECTRLVCILPPRLTANLQKPGNNSLRDNAQGLIRFSTLTPAPSFSLTRFNDLWFELIILSQQADLPQDRSLAALD